MSAFVLRVRVWTTRRRARLVVAAVLMGVAGGLAMGIAAGTRRTETAPERYTSRAGGDPDLVIIQPVGEPLNDAVAAMPGVISTLSQTFVLSFLASPIDGTPLFEENSYAGDDDFLGARIVEGRFADPLNPEEFTVNRSMAEMLEHQFGTRVGDGFSVVSYSRDQVEAKVDTAEDPAVAPFDARLVGITESPHDFDETYPTVVFSRSFIDAHPDVGVVETQIGVRLADGASADDVMARVRQLPTARSPTPARCAWSVTVPDARSASK